MKISTAGTTAIEPDKITALYESLTDELGTVPDLLIVSCSTDYDIGEILKIVRSRTPDPLVHGGTSCMGAMTEDGVVSENGRGLALMGISDPGGRYGVGASPVGDDPSGAAESAISAALEEAERPGEVPAMVWLTPVPGCEEAVIKGIGNIVGPDVPVVGGSSADNSVGGGWKQFTRDTVYGDGIVVTALFPSTELVFAFHSGYEPTRTRGTITRAGEKEPGGNRRDAPHAGSRTLYEIDGKPAGEVYNRWVDGAITDKLKEGGNILQQTTLTPLGRIAGHIGEIPYYQLSHPETVTGDGALTLFSDIGPGEEIVLMRGTVDSLITRAGRVAVSALKTSREDTDRVAGALIVYCAGCMLTVRQRLNEVVESFKTALPGVPFLGTFTFGEQGCFHTGENRHGNLMISVLLILKD